MIREEQIDKLVAKFLAVYEQVMANYKTADKIAITEALMNTVKLLHMPLAVDAYDKIREIKLNLEKIYREKLKPYSFSALRQMLQHSDCLYWGEVISMEEFNNMPPQEQGLSEEEMNHYTRLLLASLSFRQSLHYLAPAKEEPLTGAIGNKEKGVKRTKNDKWTALDIEETVLLADYLKQARVFLSDETLLSKVKMGEAFFMLTGFSKETFRQKLSDLPYSKDLPKDKFQNIQKILFKINDLIKKKLGE